MTERNAPMQPESSVPKQPGDATLIPKSYAITFGEEVAKLPIIYANAITVQVGPNEFFVTIGTVLPPEIRSTQDLETAQASETLEAQPVARFALSPVAMQQFIDVMNQQFERFVRLIQTQQSERIAESEKGNNDE